MMKIHKEGIVLILLTLLFSLGVMALVYQLAPQNAVLHWRTGICCGVIFLIVLQFFRNPNRDIYIADDDIIYAPADGKVVVIEEVHEPEYFQDKRLQISIFMSPTNVHVNRNPIGGRINYFKYHPGKYLVAWHPKSSTENERTTTVIGNDKAEVLLRQIAGALAKRIVNYVQEGEEVKQGTELGFIKFGSRVDLFLPIGSKIEVDLNQKVKGNRTIIARM